MDITQALRDAENSLRDFITAILSQKLGNDWLDKCGVTLDRIVAWRERKATESKRQEGGVVDERLLYYADFYDLKTILKKHWPYFSDALGECKTFEVLLAELETLRDPEAHRRELLPHQKHLVLGISGEIRTRIIRFRSRMETSEDCFPRIESARDSLGNIWVPGVDQHPHSVETKMTLRPGDTVEFVVTARDPGDLPIEYGIELNSDHQRRWQSSSTFAITLTDNHIRQSFFVILFIRSTRDFHASYGFDDYVKFGYTVLPQKK